MVKTDKQNKDRRIHLRVQEKEFNSYREKAKKHGISLSNWIRNILNNAK